MAGKTILSAEQIEEALQKLYKAILDALPDPDDKTPTPPLAIVGIRTRGETIARRLLAQFAEKHPTMPVHLGVLDVTFYRDDLARRRGVPLVRATDIDFDLDDCWMLLVDDVLQTGRSIRAALDALHDFGRPKLIRLAVLVDRGGRELPIAADFVGKTLTVPKGQRLQIKLRENDGQEGAYLVQKTS